MIINGKPFPTFLKFAVPNILGMLAISSAQIIDAFFIGRYIGGMELAAVNIVFPVFSFFFGTAIMMASGSAVMCAKYIGASYFKKASEIYTVTLVSLFIFVLAGSFIPLLFPSFVVRLLGANAQMEQAAATYLFYTSFFLLFFIASYVLGMFLRIEERPVFVLNVMLIGAASNVFFDWFFIVYLKKGIIGAALGTGLSEVLMTLLLAPYFFTQACRLKFVRLTTRSVKKMIIACYNGISELINEFSIGFTSIIFNWIMVVQLGVPGVAAYTVINYIFWFGVIFSYALGETLIPLISTNYGAEKPQRIKKFLSIALLTGESIGLILFIILIFRPGYAVRLFLLPNEIQATAVSLQFIQVAKWAFLFNGFNIILSSFFTAMHRPVESAIIAALRSLILPLLFLLTLPYYMEENGIFASIPAAEMLTFCIGIFLFRRFRQKQKENLINKNPLSEK